MKTQSILNVMVDMTHQEFADNLGVTLARVRHWTSRKCENTHLTDAEKAMFRAFCIRKGYAACPHCCRPEMFRDFKRPQINRFGYMCPDCHGVYMVDKHNNVGRYKW